MDWFYKLLAVYLVIISLAAVAVTCYDKRIAVKNGKYAPMGGIRSKSAGKGARPKEKTAYRRIPESTLLLICALGGSVAMLITMLKIRHKTKHAKFMIGIPAIILAQAALSIFLIVR